MIQIQSNYLNLSKMQQEHFTLCNPDQPIAWSSDSNPKQLLKFIQNAAGTFHCRFCAPDAAVTQLYWGEYGILSSYRRQYFFDFFLICATGRCVFSLHWGLCAPVTPVTLSHLVPAIAIDIFLFQLSCIKYHQPPLSIWEVLCQSSPSIYF